MVKKVEVLGSGCPRCEQTIKAVEKAIQELGIDAAIEKVEDINEIISRGVVATPAVAVDGKIVLNGRIPTLDEAKALLKGGAKMKEEKAKLDPKFAYWKGMPREEITWHPKIDENRCTGCGICVTSCGRNVFDYDWERKKAVVARPLQCMVGCTSCQVWCVFDAISFPEPQYVKDLIKKKGILSIARKQLEEMKKST